MNEESRTPQEIQKRFDSLPEDIKALVYSADMLETIQKVGQKNGLHVDQVGTLEAETADVMTGFTKPENFVENLKGSLGVDQGKAEAVAKDVNDLLLVKIRESMKKFAGQKSGGEIHNVLPAQPRVDEQKSGLPGAGEPRTFEKQPAAKVELPPSTDIMLTQKTVAAPPAPQPQAKPIYKADPYREPPE